MVRIAPRQYETPEFARFAHVQDDWSIGKHSFAILCHRSRGLIRLPAGSSESGLADANTCPNAGQGNVDQIKSRANSGIREKRAPGIRRYE